MPRLNRKLYLRFMASFLSRQIHPFSVKWCLDNTITAQIPTPVKAEDLANALVAASESLNIHQPVPDRAMSFDILMAEDNMVNQKVASKILENHGHLVTIVENGQVAVDSVKQRAEVGKPYDVILVSCLMPRS